jgi:hypothetical protein
MTFFFRGAFEGEGPVPGHCTAAREGVADGAVAGGLSEEPEDIANAKMSLSGVRAGRERESESEARSAAASSDNSGER